MSRESIDGSTGLGLTCAGGLFIGAGLDGWVGAVMGLGLALGLWGLAILVECLIKVIRR